jgi:uncharacterized membrane protein YcaP (DUF421 family)
VTILGFDLAEALTPDVSLFETAVRGLAMYALIYILLRVVLRGRTGSTTMSDLLVLVLIADAAQNAMAAEYSSLANGAVLVATIVFASFALDWLGYRIPAIERYVHPDRKPLIVNGRMIRRNLEQELMTEDELMTQLRLQGVERVSDVKAAYLEGNGEISVIPLEGGGGGVKSGGKSGGGPAA